MQELTLHKDHYPYYRYQKAKNKKSKGTIFFIHGYDSNSFYHYYFYKDLKDYDYYAIELPGNDISPVYDIKDLNVMNYAYMVANLINELKLNNIILIGHSMGGAIAMNVANLINHLINKLILVCPMNTLGTFDVYHFLFSFNPVNLKQAIKLSKFLLYDKTLLNHELADQFLKSLIQLNNKTLKYQKHLKYQMINLKNLKKLNNVEKNINVPTLLITCKNDRIINSKRTNYNLKRKIKNLQTYVINNCGHAPMIEKPKEYKKIILNYICN